MCGCPLHDNRNGVDVCTCLCQEHDQFFDQGVVLLREAVRRNQRVAQDEIKGVHNRLNAVNQLYDTVSADLSRLRQEVGVTGERGNHPFDLRTGGVASDDDGIDWKMRATAAETELALAREDTTHVANADRIRLAKDALLSSGYFNADQVDDEIAPRIHELIDAHNSGFLKMQDDLTRQINKWKDRAVVAERRMSSVRNFVNESLRVTEDE